MICLLCPEKSIGTKTTYCRVAEPYLGIAEGSDEDAVGEASRELWRISGIKITSAFRQLLAVRRLYSRGMAREGHTCIPHGLWEAGAMVVGFVVSAVAETVVV